MRLSKPCQAKSWKSTSRQNSSLLQTAHPNVTLLPPWIFCFIAPDWNSLNQLVLLNPCCISRHTCKGNTSIFSPFRSFMENMVNRSVVWVACSIESTTLKLHVTFRTHIGESSEIYRHVYRHRRADSLSKHKLLEVIYTLCLITANLLHLLWGKKKKINEIFLL